MLMLKKSFLNQQSEGIFVLQKNEVLWSRGTVTVLPLQETDGCGAHLDAASWLDGQQSVISWLLSTVWMSEEEKKTVWADQKFSEGFSNWSSS